MSEYEFTNVKKATRLGTGGKTLVSGSKKKKKEKAEIFKFERLQALYEQAKDIAAATGESIAEAFERIKEKAGFNEGGMPTQRKGNLDYRKGGMVTNTVDNRKNK